MVLLTRESAYGRIASQEKANAGLVLDDSVPVHNRAHGNGWRDNLDFVLVANVLVLH